MTRAAGWQRRAIPSSSGITLATVSCDLGFEITDRATLAFQVAPAAGAGAVVDEVVEVALDGRDLGAHEVEVDHGGRVHLVASAAGHLSFRYTASVELTTPGGVDVPAADRLTYLRQSRYCPSDRLGGFAHDEFGPAVDAWATAAHVAEWVFERVSYEPGSSGPLDSAIETLLAGHGVCRDFAHLTVALCRALSIPARVASVYAPGLSPMDFHAVTEVAVDDVWWVLDATRLAPRPTLVRVATGRDAADTAFCSTVDGDAELVTANVVATTDADLPLDDHVAPVSLG